MTRVPVLLVLLLLVLCCSLASAAVEPLTVDNFDSATAEGHWLIKFHVSWCGHCKKLAPVFEEASQAVQNSHPEVLFGDVNCESSGELCQRYNVRGYPTLLYKHQDDTTLYKGPRTVQGFVGFLERMSGPVLVDLDLESTAQSFVQDSRASGEVSFLLAGSFSKEAQATLERVARRHLLENRFAVSSQLGSLDSVRQYMNPSQRSKQALVAAIKPEEVVFLAEPFTEEELAEWVRENRFPVIPELSEHTFPVLSESPKNLIVAMLDFGQHSDLLQRAREHLFRYSKESRPDLQFAFLDLVKYRQFVQSSLSIDPAKDLPAVALLNFRDGAFQKQASFSLGDDAAMDLFLEQVESGALETETMGGSALSGAWRTFKLFIRTLLDNPYLLTGAIVVYLGLLMVLILAWRKMCSGPSDEDDMGAPADAGAVSRKDKPRGAKPSDVLAQSKKPVHEDTKAEKAAENKQD